MSMTSAETPASRHLAPRVPPLLYYARDTALDYLCHGLAVVPIIPGTKKPFVGWKRYQTVPPAVDVAAGWWERWPEAGVACVLGPVSRVVAVDVDGPDAHAALVERLGAEPRAPKILTGSRKPSRYQLLFRCPPDVPTGAKFTPWHAALEFRGAGGLSVLPPSLHGSGKRYAWQPGRSLDHLLLPDLPGPILDALRGRAQAASEAGRRLDFAPEMSAGLGRTQERALALLRTTLRATAGRGGDRVTFTAACYLAVDFGLSADQALPVLRRWNQTNCTPPWSDEALLHKLREADKLPRTRGRLLVATQGEAAEAGAGATPLPGTLVPYAAPVPDTVLADWEQFRPRPSQTRLGRPAVARAAVAALIRAAVVLQRSSVVRLPDVAIAQLVWGGNPSAWPKRWPSKLLAWLRAVKSLTVSRLACDAGCPLHESNGVPHQDVRIGLKNISEYTGCLHLFLVGGDESGVTYDFR